MATHDIGRLEKSINSVRDRLSTVAAEDDFLELIKIIHTPGWTTPAEFRLVHTLVEAIDRHVEVIDHLKHQLIETSQLVGKTERAPV